MDINYKRVVVNKTTFDDIEVGDLFRNEAGDGLFLKASRPTQINLGTAYCIRDEEGNRGSAAATMWDGSENVVRVLSVDVYVESSGKEN